MFEIGFLCPKSGKEIEKCFLSVFKPVLELKKYTPSKSFFKMEYIVIISIFNWLLVLTMLSFESCL